VPKCRTIDLREIVADISDKNPSLLRLLGVKEVSWRGLSQAINQFDVPEGTPDPVESFARLWEFFAGQFLTETNQLEYNGIKHGMRANAGGFSMQVKAGDGTEHRFEGSKFGTRFFHPADVPSAPDGNIRLRRTALNWDPSALVDSLQVIAMSINNVLAFLRKANGDDVTGVKLQYPVSNKPLLSLVSSRPDVLGMNIEENVPAPRAITQAEMLDMIKKSLKG
jgi:hypothetical protein